MSTFLQDVRYALRSFRRSPGFTFLACLTLALGIGANTALFSAVYGVLLRPLPYGNGRRLVLVEQQAQSSASPRVGFSVPEIEDYRKQNRSFDDLVEYHSMQFILLGRQPDSVNTGVVSYNFFDVLGVKPLLGRTFVPSDEQPGAEPVIVLSYKYWQQHHGGDPSVIGKSFRMNDKMHSVVGVLPPVPQYPRENDVYMTTIACPFRSSAHAIGNRDMRMMRVFGTLKPGTTLASAQADVRTIAARLKSEYPQNYKRIAGYSATVESLQHNLTVQARPLLLILLSTTGLILLIACANVANLALARMTHREHEMSVRAALGAPASRLARQVLTECTLLSLLGGVLGAALAVTSIRLLAVFMERFTTRAGEIRMDGSVLLFTLLISILSGVVFGIAPALGGHHRVTSGLARGGRGSTRRTLNLRNLLMAAQVGISFVLLIVAGLTLRSFLKLDRVNAGFDAENVVTMTLPYNFSKYQQPEKIREFYNRVLDRLEQLPGVNAVGFISGLPLANPTPSLQPLAVDGKPIDEHNNNSQVDVTIVSPNSFRSLGIPIVEGRDFSKTDSNEAPSVAIISRATGRRYWGADSPIGRRVSIDRGQVWMTVVGVVGDARFYGLDQEGMDTVYVPFSQAPSPGAIAIRTVMDAASMGRASTEVIHQIDPEQPVNNILSLAVIRENSLLNSRVTTTLLTCFAALALLLAATGLTSVVSFLVSQRTREIGIRMALGAERHTVLLMILNQGLRVVAIGLLAGGVGALLATRFVRTLLYGITSTDSITYAAVTVVLLGVAAVASYVPARRAARVDPMIALRHN